MLVRGVVLGHLSFVICHSSFVICHSSFVSGWWLIVNGGALACAGGGAGERGWQENGGRKMAERQFHVSAPMFLPAVFGTGCAGFGLVRRLSVAGARAFLT